MVQYADLDASTVRLHRRSALPHQKRALFAIGGASVCVVLVVVMVGFSSTLPEEAGVELASSSAPPRMDDATRMALRKGASEARLRSSHAGGAVLRHFDALQEKIEKDLGITGGQQHQAAAAAATQVVFPAVKPVSHVATERPRRMKMTTWFPSSEKDNARQQQQQQQQQQQPRRSSGLYSDIYPSGGAEYEPESYTYGDRDDDSENAAASATLSASKAADALHRIEALEREANSIRDEMAGRQSDVTGARKSIERELVAIYGATEKAEQSLDHSAAVQREATEALETAQSIKEEEERRAQRIAEIEERVESESRYVDELLENVEHSGGYANGIAREAAYADHAVQAIHTYFEDAFSLTKSISETGNEARGKLGEDLSAASEAVGDLENERAYGANAASMSQHYAVAARQFAQQAAGAAEGAYSAVEGSLRAQEASVQAAFQAVQSAKGAKVAEEAASSARAGAEAALRMARSVLRHTYGYYGPSLPKDPVQRAEYLVDQMLPILSRAADEMTDAVGDCQRQAAIFAEMRGDIEPLNQEGDHMELTPAEVKEVQSYADQALGGTLERLMVEMMKAVQACGTQVTGEGEEQEPQYAPPLAEDQEGSDDDEANNNNHNKEQQDDTIYNKPYDGGVQIDTNTNNSPSVTASIITAKQLVDSRVSVISAMLDKIDESLEEGDCASIRKETEVARSDFNYFETEEMKVLQGMHPADIESVDQYAQLRLMPLLQTSLDTFDRVKERCGREIFSDMPIPNSDDHFDNQGQEQEQGSNNNYNSPSAPASFDTPTNTPTHTPVHKPTAMTTSSKIVIDHMVRTIDNLMTEVSKDATDCQAADNAGVAFKAKFAALEHIAQKYESKMSDEEKAEVEQYAEDMMGSVMEKLFTVVMQVTANCGTKSFDLLGAHDVEDFYEEEARHTLAERASSGGSGYEATPEQQQPEEEETRGPYGEVLPHGEANPDAEDSVAQMKERVLELKKKLEDLRGSSSSSGSSASESGSGSESGSAAASSGGSASAASSAASASSAGSASSASGAESGAKSASAASKSA